MRKTAREVGQEIFINVVADLLVVLIGASVVTLVTTLFDLHPADLFPIELVVVCGVGLIVLAALAWRWHAFRVRALAVSQRALAPVLLIILGLGLAGAQVVLLTAVWMGTLGVPGHTAMHNLWGSVFGVVIALLGIALLWQRHRMAMDIDFCFTILKRVDQWQDKSGPLPFTMHATVFDIRRQCRVLDTLTRRGGTGTLAEYDLRVTRTRRGYMVATAKTVTKPKTEGTQVVGRTRQLRGWAVALYDIGLSTHVWRRRVLPKREIDVEVSSGDETPEPLELFGNQLDQLFNQGDGFKLYSGITTFTIKGQPGVGKSTLALQMCVTLAKQGERCLYFSLEEECGGLLHSATNYGWSKRIDRTDTASAYLGVLDDRKKDITKALERGEQDAGYVMVSSLGNRAMSLDDRMRQLQSFWDVTDDATPRPPQWVRCAVIDSLEGFANAGLEGADKSGISRDALLRLRGILGGHCDLIVFLVEDDSDSTPGFEDFVADTVIQLKRTVIAEYRVQQAEILKARNQKHALGPSVVRLFSQADEDHENKVTTARYRGTTPGVGVYPSLHFRLSQMRQLRSSGDLVSQRRQLRSSGDLVLSTGLQDLDELVASSGRLPGVRRQSTTGLLGPAGTAKGLMALNFLVEGMRENSRTLLLSMRDYSETLARPTLPQDKRRMRYVRVDSADGHFSHRFEWGLAEIADWMRRPAMEPTRMRERGTLTRLPYLFDAPPVSLTLFGRDADLQAEARAGWHFFRLLAGEYAVRGDALVQADINRLWSDALHDDIRGDLTSRLLMVSDEEGQKLPQHMTLERRKDTDAPYICWQGPRWSIEAEPDDKDLIEQENKNLLTIINQRPGNVTPEEFVDLVLRAIKFEPKADPEQYESPYERVVFDDVSQLRQRFPLLSRDRLFLPTLIDILKANGITAIFLADTDDPHDVDGNMGLPVIADNVIWTRLRKRKGVQSPPDRRWIQVQFQARPNPERGPYWLEPEPTGVAIPTLDFAPAHPDHSSTTTTD